MIGDAGDVARKQLGEHGVATLYAAGGPDLASYAAAAWASVIVTVRAQAKSVVVTAAGTPRGNELLAHVAAGSTCRWPPTRCRSTACRRWSSPGR